MIWILNRTPNFYGFDNTVEPLSSDPGGGGGGVKITSDNCRAKITGLNGVGTVGLRSDD